MEGPLAASAGQYRWNSILYTTVTPSKSTGDDLTYPPTNMKSPVPPTTGWSAGLMLWVPPTIEIEPCRPLILRVIFANDTLRRPSRLEVMEAPSAIPATRDDAFGDTVMPSLKTKMVPKGVVVWPTPAPATPSTTM